MPLAMPKPLDEIVVFLNKLYSSEKGLNDFERFKILIQLDDMKSVQPAQAFMGLGILAAFENNEKEMRHNFKNALYYGSNDPYIYFNYGVSLLKTGFPDDAKEAFKKTLSFGIGAKNLMDSLACNSMSLGDPELELQTLHMAVKLNCDGECIRLLALYVGSANMETEAEANRLLEKHLDDAYLENHSTEISEDKWKKMKTLAEALEKRI